VSTSEASTADSTTAVAMRSGAPNEQTAAAASVANADLSVSDRLPASSVSTAAMSDEKRLRMRPTGVAWNQPSCARSTWLAMRPWSARDAAIEPKGSVSTRVTVASAKADAASR